MHTRTNFDNNLVHLKKMLLDMAGKSENAVKGALEALIWQDIVKAEKIINDDNVIDQLEHDINDKALILIAKESPVASDLRKIVAALKISSEVERIGDMAVNIAKSAIHIGNEKHIKEIIDIPKMMDLALEMLTDSITAFYSDNIELAKKCAKKDDQVDEMYGKLIRELMGYIQRYPNNINQITQLAFVCRYIERLADHATNIAENVIFQVTGERYDLNA
jgi:phosphate transport system protein